MAMAEGSVTIFRFFAPREESVWHLQILASPSATIHPCTSSMSRSWNATKPQSQKQFWKNPRQPKNQLMLLYTPLKTNMTNWKIPMFNRKSSIFIHAGFSSDRHVSFRRGGNLFGYFVAHLQYNLTPNFRRLLRKRSSEPLLLVQLSQRPKELLRGGNQRASNTGKGNIIFRSSKKWMGYEICEFNL